jgi:uncharacterized membrane protein
VRADRVDGEIGAGDGATVCFGKDLAASVILPGVVGLATGLSWVCYFRALQVGEASRVAPVDKLSVVFVLAFAALFLHEPLTWKHWAGGLLIMAGTVVLASA